MRFRRAAAVVGAVGAAAGAFAVLAPSADTGQGLIRVTGTEARHILVDIGKRGISPGDTEIVTQAIYNLRITDRPIGTAEYVCTFTIARVRSCRGTFVLPRGKLVVGADIRYRQIYELAILGGTGLYNNARGTLTATRIDRKPRTREYLIFRLAG